jgi:hypothetical protein
MFIESSYQYIFQNLGKSLSLPFSGQKTISFTKRRLEAKVTTVGPTATKLTTTHSSDTKPLMENLPSRKEDPYLSIDMAMFDIVPAVPGVNIPYQDNRGTARQPAGGILPRFSAVPAVPTPAMESNDSVQVNNENSVEQERVAAPSNFTTEDEDDLVSADEKRKVFKRCHGKCVQKFCLPVGSLSVFDSCTKKCRGICNQE